jgi:hypothetical protein
VALKGNMMLLFAQQDLTSKCRQVLQAF